MAELKPPITPTLLDSLRAVFDALDESVIVISGEDHRIVFANAAAARTYRAGELPDLVGITIEALTQRFDLLDESGRALDPGTLPAARALRGEGPSERTLRFRVRDTGEEGWAQLKSGPLEVRDGEVTLVISTARDVTALHQVMASEALQRTSLKAAIEASVDGVLAIAPDRRVLWCNARFAQMWCIPDDVLRSRSDQQLLSAVTSQLADPEGFRDKVATLYGHSEERALDEVLLRDGRTFERYTAPMFGDDGTLWGRLWLFRDVSVRKIAEQRERLFVMEQTARMTAERGQRDFQFLADVTRATQRSLVESSIARRVADLTARYFDGWCAVDLVDPGGHVHRSVSACDPTRRPVARELQHAIAGHDHVRELVTDPAYPPSRSIEGPVWARDPDSLRLIRELGANAYLTVPIGSHRGRFGVVTVATRAAEGFDAEAQRVVEDLARRLGLAVENARLYAEARLAVRARNDFLSVASHELKTPIAALQLTAQSVARRAAREEPPLPPWLSAKLHVIERQCHRLAELVGRLLDVSMAISGRLDLEPEPVDLAEVVHDVVAGYADELAHSGSTLRIDASSPVVGRWDRARLEQLVQNLLSNAVKYGKRKPIDIAVARSDGEAKLVVEDQGIGIPEDARERLFERFERAVSRREYGGLGLGLFIVRQIVEAHGGRVRVEGSPGRGTRFTVELPLEGVPGHRGAAPDDRPALTH